MPTQNRRVATYLPKEIDERLKAFIAERGLKGDSAALIAILSEYFGVSHQVVQGVDYSLYVKAEQFNDLASKVLELSQAINESSLLGVVVGELLKRVEVLEQRSNQWRLPVEIDPSTSPVEVPISPGQMDLLEIGKSIILSEPKDDSLKPGLNSIDGSSSGELRPMHGYALSTRFGLSEQAVGNNKNSWKNSPNKFLEWTKKKDPDGIAWQYNPEDKLYHPITDSSLVG